MRDVRDGRPQADHGYCPRCVEEIASDVCRDAHRADPHRRKLLAPPRNEGAERAEAKVAGIPIAISNEDGWLTYTVDLQSLPHDWESILEESADQDLRRMTRERDLYRRLLDLGDQEDLHRFVESALGLVVEATGASQGYLEIRSVDGDDSRTWSASARMTEGEVESVRDRISHGILAATLASGETIVTNAALFDDRFKSRESVQVRRIGAVVCAPVGTRPGRGAIYLERAVEDGAFSDEGRGCLDIVARHLSTLSDRLLVRASTDSREDHVRPLRDRYVLSSIIGRSLALAQVLEQAMLAAPLDVTVLLSGASGTGKTQLAQAIHANSHRRTGPYVELNCGALPETLIESELFGARAGAHSTANRDIQGKVASAEGGTLFLDEIGELPWASQAKLLQLLQSRQYYPLGSTVPKHADIRIIAATNADLKRLVDDRAFREDLYFRLHVLALEMPSLAARKADLRPLAEALCARVVAQNRLPALELSEEAYASISSTEWPGNVRQLESVVAAGAIRAAGQGVDHIRAVHLFPDRAQSAAPEGDLDPRESFQQATRRFQHDLIAKSLVEADWNVSEVARRLDLARSHLYTLIEGFGLERGSAGGRSRSKS